MGLTGTDCGINCKSIEILLNQICSKAAQSYKASMGAQNNEGQAVPANFFFASESNLCQHGQYHMSTLPAPPILIPTP